ncbi:hypothetical protein HKX48_008401 [Thoreauomyces humboldtii]|nr:hypothetical protein HKX48_008401 [Thoreauomyces humboldtii]
MEEEAKKLAMVRREAIQLREEQRREAEALELAGAAQPRATRGLSPSPVTQRRWWGTELNRQAFYLPTTLLAFVYAYTIATDGVDSGDACCV